MFHPPQQRYHHPVTASMHPDSITACNYQSNRLADSCSVIPPSSSDDDDDDDEEKEHPFQDRAISALSLWEDFQLPEHVRLNEILPLMHQALPKSSPFSSSSASSSSSSNNSDDSAWKPPPTILRFEHYSSSSATKFFFDVDDEDDHSDDDDDDEQVEEDVVSFTSDDDDWIQQLQQQPPLRSSKMIGAFPKADDYSNREIVWTPPTRSNALARMPLVSPLTAVPPKLPLLPTPTLGIQPLHCKTIQPHRKQHATSYRCMKTPSTASSSNTQTTPHPLISLRPLVIWTSEARSSPLDDDDDDKSEDDVSVLTPADLHYQQKPWLPSCDSLFDERWKKCPWRQHVHEPFAPPLQRSTTARDVWTNHELDWLTDEEDSLSTLTTAVSNSSSSSSWYDDDNEGEDELEDEENNEQDI
jgi:hypothetical protein